MCGLAGIVGGSFSLDRFQCTLNQMGLSSPSRAGRRLRSTRLDPGACVGLVHRRRPSSIFRPLGISA